MAFLHIRGTLTHVVEGFTDGLISPGRCGADLVCEWQSYGREMVCLSIWGQQAGGQYFPPGTLRSRAELQP